MELIIEQELYAGTGALLTVPEIDSWDDIESYYVKWDTLHYQLKSDKMWRQLELNSETIDVIDWKHPIRVTVHEQFEDGTHGELLDSTE